MSHEHTIKLKADNVPSKKHKPFIERLNPYRIISMILLCMFSIVFVFPFYWIITGAFKIQVVATQLPPQWFPLELVLDNWVTLCENSVRGRMFHVFLVRV